MTIIKIRDPRLTIHDFRIYEDKEKTEIDFDMVIPSELCGEEENLQNSIETAINRISKHEYSLNITFDLGKN